MPIAIAPVIEFVPVPRTPEFAAELHEAEFVLIPQCMSRIADSALRDPILMSSAHLANNIATLKTGLQAGLSDEALQAPYLNYLLYLDAVNHWTNAPAGVRFPKGRPMKTRRRKIEEAQAALAPHGRQLSIMLATQRGLLTRLHEALAREKSPQRRAGLQQEIANVKAVIAIREQEMAEALATAEAERNVPSRA